MRQTDKPVRTIEGEQPPGQAVSGHQVLDLDHLSHYTLGDTALAVEILQLFSAQVNVYLDGLQAAEDGIAWQEVAHGLKGSARAIGAWALADLAERAEHGRLTDVAHTRRKYLTGLRHEVERTKVQITVILAENQAA